MGGASEEESPKAPQQESPEQEEVQEKAEVVQLDGLDNTRNSQVVMPTHKFATDGLLQQWKFTAGRNGIVHFQIYRPMSNNAALCANEGDNCKCNGTVYYGKRFKNHKPGHGAITSYDEMMQGNTSSRVVNGSISCNRAGFGNDPVPNYYKQCYCVSKVNNRTFALVGENIYQVTKLGDNLFEVPAMKQIPFKKGDVVGLRFPDLGIVKFIASEEEVRIAPGSSRGIGVGMNFPTATKRKYALLTSHKKVDTVNVKELGGNNAAPALSAQHILKHYLRKKLGTPVDGAYWLKSRHMKKPEQVYCNFSYRKGRGYMLIGSVASGDSWAQFDSGSYPFNPVMSYGTYDKYARNGTYYMPWARFDASAAVDNTPYNCAVGGFKYNNAGKFCGQKRDNKKRIQLKGGFTEIMLATGNGKYWVVADRQKIEYPHKDRKSKITPLATSGNFEGKCEQNKYIYIESHGGKKETPWINMGSGHACDSNMMMWGEAASKNNTKFMSENGGVQIFVGGLFAGHNRRSSFPHNPSHHRAPGKGGYSSTFREAQQVCNAMGKKMCTRKQLTEANKKGYSKCACGWMDTKIDKSRYVVGYPTNIDKWGSLQGTGKHKPSWCGKPGLNTCGYVRKDQGIWGREGADIYCCDPYQYHSHFKKLDAPYNMARVWISRLEQKFEDTYGMELPINAQFVVFNKGYGLYVKKDKRGYRCVGHSKGVMSRKGLKIKTQIPENAIRVDPKTLALFTKPIKSLNIKQNSEWPNIIGTDKIIRYGTTLQLENTGIKQYLNGSNKKYWQSTSSKNLQVFTYNKKDSNGWLVKSVRGKGTIDSNGNGNEKADFGKPIISGSIVRLEHVTTGRNLSSNTAFVAPGTQYPEVSLDGKGVAGDSNDYWRIETTGSKYWYVNAPVRFVHVNTGKCLQAGSTTYNTEASLSQRDPYLRDSNGKKLMGCGNGACCASGYCRGSNRSLCVPCAGVPDSAGGFSVNVLYTDVTRGTNDSWLSKNYSIPSIAVSKCEKYLQKIESAKQAIDSGALNKSSLKATIRKYRTKYNKECNKISKYAYDRVINPYVAKVNSTTSVLNRENKIFNSIQNRKNRKIKTKEDKTQTKVVRDTELQRLLAKKCLPVKRCVGLAKAGNEPVAKQCKSLSGYMKEGEITDTLIEQIKKIKRSGDKVSNYDIRTHNNYYKLAKATKIGSCY